MTPSDILSHRTRDPESTRNNLLEAAFVEIYENGYERASLDQILAKAGVTKGALYHHFGSKADLLYAVIDEIIYGYMMERWIKPIDASTDPIQGLLDTGLAFMKNQLHEDLERGCPLNNLVQELSNEDEGFRIRLNRVFDDWRLGIARNLERGQQDGTVRSDIDAVATATYIVASLEGLAGTAKLTRDLKLTSSAGHVLFQFIAGLRIDSSKGREAA